MLKIQVLLGSTRPQRQGEKVARWVMHMASQQPQLEVEYLDLRDWPLPFFSESTPSPNQYSHELVSNWVQKIQSADGYIFVTPEYNRSIPAVLKNALDSAFDAWHHKPAAFVGYSGDITGAARAVEHLRLVSVALHMLPTRDAIHIPTVWRQFNEQGDLLDETIKRKCVPLFAQLIWLGSLLKTARVQEIINKGV